MTQCVFYAIAVLYDTNNESAVLTLAAEASEEGVHMCMYSIWMPIHGASQ